MVLRMFALVACGLTAMPAVASGPTPTQAEREAMARACAHLRAEPPAERVCVANQEQALRDSGGAPALQALPDSDRELVMRACAHLLRAGPGHYYACLKREEQAALSQPLALAEIPPSYRLEILVACSRSTRYGPWSHQQCLSAETKAARGLDSLLGAMRSEQRSRVSNGCSAERATRGLAAFYACVKAAAR